MPGPQNNPPAVPFTPPLPSANQTSATRPRPGQNAGVQSYDQLQNQYQAFLPTILPQITQAQNQYNRLGASIPGIEAQVQSGIGNYQQAAGLQQQQLGLQGDQYDIQQGALNRAGQLDPAQYALQQQAFGIQGQGILRNQSYVRQAHAMNQSDIEAQGVAGGSLFTAGQHENVGREKASFDQQIAGLHDQAKSLGINKQGAALSFHEQMAQLQDSQKNLGILQKQLGISGQEITNRTEQAIQQLGLQGMVSVDQVHQAMVDAANGIITPFSGLISQIYQNSGIRPLTSTQAAANG